MAKRVAIIILFALATIACQAAVVTLKSGKKVYGEILINNTEVVIVRDSEGARFQYPASEVISVKEEEAVKEETPQEEDKIPQGKKVTFLLGFGGGGTFVPNDMNGGFVTGELLIGSRYIGKKSIFLGGGLSVNSMFAGGLTYIFLPLQVAVKIPFMEGQHSPFVGANIGYGFGISRDCKGGIFTSAEIGYRYLIGRSSLYVSVRAQFQQATITGQTTVEETTYNDHAGRNFVILGAHFGISF